MPITRGSYSHLTVFCPKMKLRDLTTLVSRLGNTVTCHIIAFKRKMVIKINYYARNKASRNEVGFLWKSVTLYLCTFVSGYYIKSQFITHCHQGSHSSANF